MTVALTVTFVHVFQISQFHFVIDYIEVDASITRLLEAGKLASTGKLKEKKIAVIGLIHTRYFGTQYCDKKIKRYVIKI